MKMTITGTGDSILIQGYPREGYPGLDEIKAFIAKGQARFANLETCVTDWDTYCSAYSGGTWMNAEPRVLEQILDFGFNYLGFANNHTMDLGPDGLLETVENVKVTGTAIAGAGEDLFEAAKPVYRDLPGGRVAFIAVSASFHPAARAGYASKDLPGRPGVNALRHSKKLLLTQEHMDEMKKIAQASQINAYEEISRAQGFRPPLPEGTMEFGGLSIALSPDGKEGIATACDKRDMKRIKDAITDARLIADYVVIMFHTHDIDGGNQQGNAAYAEEFCRGVIDAGADVVFGGGTHQLKPIEIYNGKPIFYSLGNFCFQSNMVERQPADMLDYFRIEETSGPQALAARNKGWTIGQHTVLEHFLTVIPYLAFEDGKLTEAELMPVGLGFHKPRTFKGIPYPADMEEGKRIFETLKHISAPFGTKLTRDDKGIIHIDV